MFEKEKATQWLQLLIKLDISNVNEFQTPKDMQISLQGKFI